MSDRSRGEGWWQAADGKWYPPELLDAPRQQWTTTELTPVVPGGEDTVVPPGVVAQVTVGIATLVMAAVGVSGIAFASSIREAGDGFLDDADSLDAAGLWSGFSVLSLLALAVSAVSVVVWIFRTSKVIDRRGAKYRRWSPRWAFWAWIVPFANLVLPRLVMAEIERCVSEPYYGQPIEDRWTQRNRFSLGDAWWFLWVAGNVVSYVSTIASDPLTDSAGRYATFVTIGSMGSFLVALAGVVLILEIRAIAAAGSARS